MSSAEVAPPLVRHLHPQQHRRAMLASISSAPVSEPARESSGQASCAASTERAQHLEATAPARQRNYGGVALSDDCRAGHAPGRTAAVLSIMCKGCAAPNSVRQPPAPPRSLDGTYLDNPRERARAQIDRASTLCSVRGGCPAPHNSGVSPARQRRQRCKLSQLARELARVWVVHCAVQHVWRLQSAKLGANFPRMDADPCSKHVSHP